LNLRQYVTDIFFGQDGESPCVQLDVLFKFDA